MRRLAAAALLLFLVLVPVTPAGAWSRSIDYNLVAVEERGRSGSILLATLTISYPGNGSIVVTAGGAVDNVTLLSMVQAVKLAGLLAGRDWRTMDFNITIHVPYKVSGPSGSAMTALVVYTFLAGSPAMNYTGIAVTGAISPDGLVASVGSVDVKCAAAGERGIPFYYPLVNLTARLEEECSGTTYTGLLNLTATVYGSLPPEPGLGVFPLPASFNETMKQAARRMVNHALELLEEARKHGASDAEVSGAMVLVNRSLEIVEDHPYAAASLAFTSLLNATRIYYLYASGVARGSVNGSFLEAERARVEEELDRLEETLNSMPREGSIYYVEFVATAYTRLATARSSLLAYQELIDKNPYDAVYELAHASARIDSIREWIRSANASINETPRLSIGDVERLAVLVSDYVETSAAYAQALARYMVDNYSRDPNLLVYIDVIGSLVRQARSYMEQGDPVAAVGFYREALSRSLDMLFQASLGAYRGPTGILDDYLLELERVYTILSERLLSRGLTPGLAPAYYDYALVLEGQGDPVSAVLLMEEAASSAIIWGLLTVSPGTPLNTTSTARSGFTGEGGEVGGGAPGIPPSVAVAGVLVAFLLGYMASVRMVSRILERLEIV